MKKIAIITAGVILAGAAHATVLPDTNNVTMLDCTLLAEDVRLTRSNDVELAYNCDTVNNVVVVAGCHTSGRQTSRTAEVINCQAGPDGALNTGDDVCDPPVAVTVTGAVIWRALTTGGQMQGQYPGVSCDDAGAAADGVATAQ